MRSQPNLSGRVFGLSDAQPQRPGGHLPQSKGKREVRVGRRRPSARRNGTPYALFDDNRGDRNAWVRKLGTQTLTAIAYTGANAKGTAGAPLGITVTVVYEPPSSVGMLQLAPPADLWRLRAGATSHQSPNTAAQVRDLSAMIAELNQSSIFCRCHLMSGDDDKSAHVGLHQLSRLLPSPTNRCMQEFA
jgi:hypothetical protein